jgi:hypothetical protein
MGYRDTDVVERLVAIAKEYQKHPKDTKLPPEKLTPKLTPEQEVGLGTSVLATGQAMCAFLKEEMNNRSDKCSIDAIIKVAKHYGFDQEFDKEFKELQANAKQKIEKRSFLTKVKDFFKDSQDSQKACQDIMQEPAFENVADKRDKVIDVLAVHYRDHYKASTPDEMIKETHRRFDAVIKAREGVSSPEQKQVRSESVNKARAGLVAATERAASSPEKTSDVTQQMAPQGQAKPSSRGR